MIATVPVIKITAMDSLRRSVLAGIKFQRPVSPGNGVKRRGIIVTLAVFIFETTGIRGIKHIVERGGVIQIQRQAPLVPSGVFTTGIIKPAAQSPGFTLVALDLNAGIARIFPRHQTNTGLRTGNALQVFQPLFQTA